MDADWGDPAAPMWMRECVGSLYEAGDLPSDGVIRGIDDWRYDQLRPAVATRDPDAHLTALFGMTTARFRARLDGGDGADTARALLHAGTARGVCHWLETRGQLWPFYRAWRDTRDRDPDGTAAFTRVTGQTPAEADAAWRAWIAHAH